MIINITMNIKSLLSILVVCLLVARIDGSLSVDPVTNILKDEYNRFRVMHGVNVVYKEFPYYPIRT